MISNYKNERKEFRSNAKAGNNASQSEVINSIQTRSKNSNVFKNRIPFYKNKKVVHIDKNSHYIRKEHLNRPRQNDKINNDEQVSEILINEENADSASNKELLQGNKNHSQNGVNTNDSNKNEVAQPNISLTSANTTMTYANTENQKAARGQIPPKKIQESIKN